VELKECAKDALGSEMVQAWIKKKHQVPVFGMAGKAQLPGEEREPFMIRIRKRGVSAGNIRSGWTRRNRSAAAGGFGGETGGGKTKVLWQSFVTVLIIFLKRGSNQWQRPDWGCPRG
ncbi:MAG: hypothetical protein ACP5IL_17720, partial [Syntrophobacteraceae bacterium]